MIRAHPTIRIAVRVRARGGVEAHVVHQRLRRLAAEPHHGVTRAHQLLELANEPEAQRILPVRES